MKPYIAQKLPIKDINWELLIENIAKVNRAIAKYDGFLQIIPNPKLLLSPLTMKEAVLSLKIEGTQATFENVEKIQQILNLYNNLKEEIKVLDFLFSSPIFTTKIFHQHTSIEKRNIYRIIHFLVEKNLIVTENSKKERNRIYFFKKLLYIIK